MCRSPPATALGAARVASDIVLLGQDMAPIADAVRISGQASRRIVQNFLISGGYNVVAVPLALVGIATPLCRRAGDVAVLDHGFTERAEAEVMDILGILIPASLFLSFLGLVFFVWAMKTRQFDDPEGDANRILTKDWDDRPKP